MKILALEPYHGGSHRAFLEGWSERSEHDWTILGLPPYKWKWRMRHSAIHFAGEIERSFLVENRPDLLFCSDMLNLAELVGLLPRSLAAVPKVVYFHENQLTYPVQFEDERDYQFAMTNLTTALAADEVWFNSRFHLESFLNALDRFLRKMPDHPPLERIAEIEEKSSVHSPGVEPFPVRGPREAGPLRILWSSRWEHDKNPEDFFQALLMLKSKGVDFRLSILGESFRNSPKVFQEMKEEFKNRIDRWGFQESREEYCLALMETDVYVSTANHEFFGIGAVEAMLAGNYPLFPPRLSYPELLEVTNPSDSSEFLYDGTPQSLSDSLARIDVKLREGTLWDEDAQGVHGRISRFEWPQLVGDMDESLQKVCDKGK